MSDPARFGKWIVRSKIDAGGQGTVYEVQQQIGNGSTQLLIAIEQAIEQIARLGYKREGAQQLLGVVVDTVRQESQVVRALKHSHRGGEQAAERFRAEIETLRRVEHEALLPLIDANVGEKWFVTNRYERTLNDSLRDTAGRPTAALQSLRPVVEAVARLHDNNIVHRDIKPDNIFLRASGDLVLGDFGIAFDMGEEEGRLTRSQERVGSRDWMPPWAAFGRVADVVPAFDVHTLGKVLWAMTIGELRLPTRYDFYAQMTVRERCPNAPGAREVDALLAECVGEHPEQCIANAAELLKRVDEILDALALGIVPVTASERRCLVCGKGRYSSVTRRDLDEIRDFGLSPVASNRFNIDACSNCGHVQLFFFDEGRQLPAWPA